MKLSTRFTVALVAMVAVTVVFIGLLSHHFVVETILPIALQNLKSNAQRLSERLQSEVESVRHDIAVVRTIPLVDLLIRSRGEQSTEASEQSSELRERLTNHFLAELSAKPAYLQMRLIGLANGGREIVRVERRSQGDTPFIVPDDQLQAKGDRDYFQSTIALSGGEIYVSDVNLNQEYGKVQEPHIPVLRVAAPIRARDGSVFGIIAINVDMRPFLEQLRTAVPAGHTLYVLNGKGDYLIHPNPEREFGSDLASKAGLQDDFPDLAGSERSIGAFASIMSHKDGAKVGLSAATVRLGGGPLITLIETLPYSAIMAPANEVRRSAFLVGGAAFLVAILVSLLVGRSLSHPLRQLTLALDSMNSDAPVAPPTDAPGEIGLAARAFESMAQNIREKNARLLDEIELHRQAEIELRRQFERAGLFGAAIDSAQEAMIVEKLDGTISGWNRAAAHLFGYTADEAIGQQSCIIVPPDRQGEARHILNRMRYGESLERMETVRVAKGERRILVSLSISPVVLASGEIIGVSTIARDAASERQAEAVRLALESSPDAVVMVDRRGDIVLVNAETERVFGYTREDLIGQSVELLIPHRYRFRHQEHRKGYDQDPHVRTMNDVQNLVAQRKDGTEFRAEISLHPVQMRDGQCTMAVVRDITERIASQAAIARYTEELRRSNADLEQFAYVASHDLQEPLRMVASYTELLAQRYKGKLDETADKYIHFAVDGARRMKDLVNALLEYSRVDKRTLDAKPTDIKDLVQSVVKAIGPLIEEHKAEVSCENVPAVSADRELTELLLQNLIANAIKFHSELRPKVKIASAKDGDMCVISVEDNGIGIDEKYADRVFQMFQRLHSREKFKGNGIGLAVARKIVERHGGKIWFKSRPLLGTTFYFTLPLTREN